jgi:HSP20 family protein
MTDKQEIANQQGEVARTEAARERRRFTPAVDIYETKDGLVLLADMPGVSPEGIDINLERNELTVIGHVEELDTGDMSVSYREYHTGDYVRSFTLPDVVDRDRIEATMKDGVLKLTLPTAEEAKSRKIPVKGA